MCIQDASSRGPSVVACGGGGGGAEEEGRPEQGNSRRYGFNNHSRNMLGFFKKKNMTVAAPVA